MRPSVYLILELCSSEEKKPTLFSMQKGDRRIRPFKENKIVQYQKSVSFLRNI